MIKYLGFPLLVLLFCTACSDKRGNLVSAEDNASGFCLVTDSVPDVILEVRYYSTFNFIGQRIDGYEQPTAMLT
ncbi:MAG: peptidase M15, partial [Bacteroidaceae bacterium]|nr:peptidase M15 [Bacteroidaceae bacterium]